MLIPAPCTSATRATESEPRANFGIRAKAGKVGVGRPRGIEAMLPTRGTESRSRLTTTVMTSRVKMAAIFSVFRKRLKMSMRMTELTATAVIVKSHCGIFRSQSTISISLLLPDGS